MQQVASQPGAAPAWLAYHRTVPPRLTHNPDPEIHRLIISIPKSAIRRSLYLLLPNPRPPSPQRPKPQSVSSARFSVIPWPAPVSTRSSSGHPRRPRRPRRGPRPRSPSLLHLPSPARLAPLARTRSAPSSSRGSLQTSRKGSCTTCCAGSRDSRRPRSTSRATSPWASRSSPPRTRPSPQRLRSRFVSVLDGGRGFGLRRDEM